MYDAFGGFFGRYLWFNHQAHRVFAQGVRAVLSHRKLSITQKITIGGKLLLILWDVFVNCNLFEESMTQI